MMFNNNQTRQEARANIEAQYLGCLVLDNSLVDEVNVSPEVFQSPYHRNLLKLLIKQVKKGGIFDIDTVSVMSDKDIESIGGITYLVDVMNSVASVNQFKHYEKLVHSFYKQDSMRDAAIEFLQDLGQGAGDERLEQYIQDVQRVELATTKPSENFKSKLFARYQEHQDSPLEGLTGVDTGSNVLNKITDGWQRKDLIVIGARPSMGKTLFGLGTIFKGSQRDKDIVPTFMSAEMAVGGVVDRLIANAGRLNLSKLRNFNKYVQTDKDMTAYNNAVGVLEESEFDVIECNTVPEIRANMRRRMKEQPNKKHICCIDFLTQLRPVNPTGNANKDYGDMVLDLKQMAKDLNIPVILLVQLNRQNEMRQDKRPTMADIRDTGTVEQAADIIGFLHREDYYERDKSQHTNILELNLAKNRQGGTGLVKFYVDLATQNFTDLARNA
jgi:replicative DNA helicase